MEGKNEFGGRKLVWTSNNANCPLGIKSVGAARPAQEAPPAMQWSQGL